jgi:kynurenine formamidase
MEIIDISGPIYEGMWEYGFPQGHFRILQMDFDYLGHRYKHEGFEGLIGMTGTYMETESAYHGYKKAIPTHKISLQKLVNVDSYILKIPYEDLELKDNRNIIQLKDILKAEIEDIPHNSAILICTGYGDNWDKKDYIDKSPFFKKEALYYLLDKKPSILGSDFPAWENKLNPETHLDRLFNSNAILLFNCKNLNKVKKYKVKLIALPIKILNVSMCPCRVVVIEE